MPTLKFYQDHFEKVFVMDESKKIPETAEKARELTANEEISEAHQTHQAPGAKTKYKARHAAKRSGPGVKFVVSAIIIFVLLCVIGFGGYKLWVWYTDNQNSGNQKNEARSHVTVATQPQKIEGVEKEVAMYDVDFDGLKEMNNDTVAWLKVEGTEIEYPVVQASDNCYYLDHSYDGSWNSTGWVFADYRNAVDGTDKNLIIYGHNRKDKSMFGSLHDAFNEEWQENEDNRYIVLATDNEYGIYEVFSLYSIPVEDYYITTSFDSDEEFGEFAETLKNRSVYDFGVDVSGSDHILTLSTCSNMDAHRAVMHAKKVFAKDTSK